MLTMHKTMPFVNLVLLTCVTMPILSAQSQAAPVLKLPSIFGDHMVLQQGRDIPVWGWTEPGGTVHVTLANRSVKTQADASGKWMARLPALPTSKDPVEMRVESKGEAIVYSDVLLGDVWLCSGQSNMAMGVGAMRDAEKVVAEADHPRLRMFLVHRQVGFEECEDLQGEWVVCTPENIMMAGGWKGFSAVGYYFGRALLETQDRPIGLIGSYVGGSPIHSWMSIGALQSFPGRQTDTARQLDAFLKAKDELPVAMAHHAKVLLPAWEKELAERNEAHRENLAEWKVAVQRAQEQNQPAPPRPPPGGVSRRPLEPDQHFRHATVLFNGMLRPLIPFAITGAIWYQGEANTYQTKAEEYRHLQPLMIADWRDRWGQGDFPFLFVQLPNLETDKEWWPVLRESQRHTLAVPNTGMAVAIDIGDPSDLHPAFKRPIGERLALIARHQVYGEDVVFSGPMIEAAERREGKVVLSFKHLGGGLITGELSETFEVGETQAVLGGFEIAGADGIFLPAQARIEAAQVVVWHDQLEPAKSVRYAWAPNPTAANLYNRAGLPASPFAIDVQGEQTPPVSEGSQ